jgi:hypothetical protein
MSREHVEHIQSQMLPWQACEWCYPGPDTSLKTLSLDHDSGACSVIVRLPAGWQAPLSAIACDEELFVLDGRLEIMGRELATHGYAWLPAGTERGQMGSRDGATLLAFYSAQPRPAQQLSGDKRENAAIIHDAFAMPWSSAGMDPAYGDAGMRWKILREDTDAQDFTMLVSTPPHLIPPNWSGPQETHDCVEEAFVVSGDFLSPIGTMHGGAYFWRPPHILHGPYGSVGGNLSLIRTLGHPLENNWSEHEVTLSPAPAYRPVIPAELKGQLKDWVEPAPY